MPAEIVEAPPGQSAEAVAAQAAKTTVNVSQMPVSPEPSPPPKPGSARSRLSAELHKKFGGEEITTAPVPSKGAEAPPGAETAKPKAALPEGASESTPEAPSSPAKPEDAKRTPELPSVEEAKAKKMSPWKLVDQYKARALEAETKIAELQKQVQPEAERKAASEKLADYEKRIKEMTDDLRFHNAEKYDPDIVKAKQDYEKAWTRAMSELSEITLKDPQTEQARQVTAQDLLDLVNLPLGKAREIADAAFGPFADDVMAHRKEIRRLYDERVAKLQELKNNGAEREKQRESQRQEAEGKVKSVIGQIYQQAIEAAAKDPKHGHFFRPREVKTDDDKAWNERLERGYKFVDESYAGDPKDPSLTPDQRAEIVQRHAAVRHRAASWGALRYDNERLSKRLAEVEAELKAIKESSPSTTGRGAPAPAEKLTGMAALRSELHKIARPS